MSDAQTGWGCLKLLGIFAGVALVIAVVVQGPEMYLDHVSSSFRECVEWRGEHQPEAAVKWEIKPTKREPIACEEIYDWTGWLGYLPHTAEEYEYDRAYAAAKARGGQLDYVSTVEPSAVGRAKALDSLTELAHRKEDADIVMATEESVESYLWGIDETKGQRVAERRAEYSRVLNNGYGPPGRWTGLASGLTLYELTGDRSVLADVVERSIEVYKDRTPRDCSSCRRFFEMARSACMEGMREEGQTLIDMAKAAWKAKETKAPEFPAARGEFTEEERERYRKRAKDRKRLKVEKLEVLHAACRTGKETGETASAGLDLSQRWRAPETRRRVGDALELDWWERHMVAVAHAAADGSVEVSTLSESLFDSEASEDRDGRESKDTIVRAAVNEMHYLSGAGVDRVPARAAGIPISAEDLLMASNYLEEKATGAEASWPGPAAKALKMMAVVSLAETGAVDRAVGLTKTLTAGSHLSKRRLAVFRGTMYRYMGEPAAAAESFAEANSVEKTLEITVERVAALGAAGEPERAMKLLEDVDFDEGRLTLQTVERQKPVGFVYALAFRLKNEPGAYLQDTLPDALQPDSLTEVESEYFADYLRYAYEANTAEEPRRHLIRRAPQNLKSDVWYLLAMESAVDDDEYDVEVWLDYVTGRKASTEPRVANWWRAEVARWRGDEETAERWMERLWEMGRKDLPFWSSASDRRRR